MLEILLKITPLLVSLGMLWYAQKQWRKVSKKIAMIDAVGAAMEVLPAWYTGRMMADQWWFGLTTISGTTIAVKTISAISDDGKWMDVELLTTDELPEKCSDRFLCAVADDRRKASVQIATIVCAYELLTS
jgi:hypothetical protein